MNLSELLESAVIEGIVVDNISFVKGKAIAIVDFGVPGFDTTFSIPVDSKAFLSKLNKDIKPSLISAKIPTAFIPSTQANPPGVIASHLLKKCKKHPDYRGERKPRCSTKNPNGCEKCWSIYRASMDTSQ